MELLNKVDKKIILIFVGGFLFILFFIVWLVVSIKKEECNTPGQCNADDFFRYNFTIYFSYAIMFLGFFLILIGFKNDLKKLISKAKEKIIPK